MDEKDGVFLGIDLQENVSQVSYYNASVKAPQAADDNGMVMIPNSIKLSEVLNANEGTGKPMEELVSVLGLLIEIGKRAAGRRKVASICITLDSFRIEYLDCIAEAMRRLLYTKEQYEIIGRSEAFAYYAFCQRKELYSNGTILLDLDETGLKTYGLDSVRKNGVDYIYEKRQDFLQQELQLAGRQQIPIEEVSRQLCEIIEELMKGRIVSSMYLTGKGFDYEKLPEQLTKTICNRRKAFVGQNLYVKGACYAAKERVQPEVFDNLMLHCQERIGCKIETDISERAQRKRFRIVRAGINWYGAERDMDFILEGEREISLLITGFDGTVREEIIDISEIPFREGKTTRIHMNLKFTARDRCLITIKDMGFGAFVKSSGKVFYLELNL